MANHVIYDRIWESKKLARCSRQAALAYPWIYLIADDWGRFEYLPRAIWGRVFGSRDDIRPSEVAAWLEEYRTVGLLEIYEHLPTTSPEGRGSLPTTSPEGRRHATTTVAVWTRFVGPPPSKRRASLLPARNGGYDSEGLKGVSRFHSEAASQRNGSKSQRSGSEPLPNRSPETGSRKQEAGSGNLEQRIPTPTLPAEREGGNDSEPGEGRRGNGTNPRANGTNPRAQRTNPRANGTSLRGNRNDQADRILGVWTRLAAAVFVEVPLDARDRIVRSLREGKPTWQVAGSISEMVRTEAVGSFQIEPDAPWPPDGWLDGMTNDDRGPLADAVNSGT